MGIVSCTISGNDNDSKFASIVAAEDSDSGNSTIMNKINEIEISTDFAIFSCNTIKQSVCTVHYGLTDNKNEFILSSPSYTEDNISHEFSMLNLISGKTYYYMIESKSTAPPLQVDETDVFSFNTTPPLYESVGRDFFVRQGPGQCGSTAFYIIFKHYGYHKYGGTFFDANYCSNIDHSWDLHEDLTLLTAFSKTSKWLSVESLGITCDRLYKKIEDLSIHVNNECQPFFVVDGNCENLNDSEKEEEFKYILNNFLKKNRPVILHIERPIPLYDPGLFQLFPGHFIVLIGYEKESKKVYYVDPNKLISEKYVLSVDYDDFIHNKWYGHSVLYPYGLWDGGWIGFYSKK